MVRYVSELQDESALSERLAILPEKHTDIDN